MTTDPDGAGLLAELLVLSGFATARTCGEDAATGALTAFERPTLDSAVTTVFRLTENGTKQTISESCAETNGAGFPSNRTRVPAAVYGSRCEESS